MTKTCKDCLNELALTEFNRNKFGKLGLQPYCKKCSNLRKVKWARANPDKRKSYTNFREEKRRHRHDWLARNPEKRAAHKAVEKELYHGRMQASPCCQLCLGTKQLEAHHEDYTRPLEVVWLCNACHRLLTVIEKLEPRHDHI